MVQNSSKYHSFCLTVNYAIKRCVLYVFDILLQVCHICVCCAALASVGRPAVGVYGECSVFDISRILNPKRKTIRKCTAFFGFYVLLILTHRELTSADTQLIPNNSNTNHHIVKILVFWTICILFNRPNRRNMFISRLDSHVE